MEVDPDLNVNLLKDRDYEDSVDGDFEAEVQKNYKSQVVENANKKAEADGFDCWYVCDDPDCLKPIQEGKNRFDCT